MQDNTKSGAREALELFTSGASADGNRFRLWSAIRLDGWNMIAWNALRKAQVDSRVYDLDTYIHH